MTIFFKKNHFSFAFFSLWLTHRFYCSVSTTPQATFYSLANKLCEAIEKKPPTV